MSSLTNTELLFWLLGDRGFLTLLETDKIDKPMVLEAVLTALNKAVSSDRSSNVISLLIKFRDSKFFDGIKFFINSLTVYLFDEALLTSIIEKTLLLFDKFMETLPYDSTDVVSLNLTIMESKVTKLSPDVSRSLLVKIDRMKMKVDQSSDQRNNNNVARKEDRSMKPRKDLNEERPPPEDFRTLSIFPTSDDFNLKDGEVVYLRKNKINEAYNDLDTYLDVQFRLLREDFIRPMRDGIKEYKHSIQTGQKMNNKDVKIYGEARIMHPDISQRGLIYKIQFSLEGLKYVRWENSKRLIYGSLVCFSYDGFKTLTFATVADRNPNDLKAGLKMGFLLYMLSLIFRVSFIINWKIFLLTLMVGEVN